MSRLTVRRVLFGFALMSVGVLQAQTACPNPYDGNGDGVVAIGDLLDLLGL